MTDRTIFDNLVAGLSADERLDLLDVILKGSALSQEPLYEAAANQPSPKSDYAARHAALGLVARLLLFVRTLFSGKKGEELLREDDLRAIALRVDARFPGLVDRRRSVLLPPFAEELRRLRDAARFFYETLDRSVERDKAAFFAFLGSMELADVHARLISGTDPFLAAASLERYDEASVRAKVIEAYDGAISSMTESGRKAMYHDVRSVLFLKRLSGFLFDRLLIAFRHGSATGQAAAFAEVRDLLLDLGDILFSMAAPPGSSLLAAIFCFVERDELFKPGSNPEGLLGADLAKSEASLAKIRAFNAHIPLVDIMRLVSGDPDYCPRELAGGEDWLALYRSFWKERLEQRFDEWRSELRFRELAKEVVSFVGEPGMKGFANIAREGTESAPPVMLESALAFLDAFYRGPVVREINRPLKLVLVDGEFYRKDNRLEFTDAYDGLLHLGDSIAGLDARLSPEGELGASWAMANAEIAPLQIKRRKVQTAARAAEDEAERIVRRAAESLKTLMRVISGILKGEAGGRYDSLANLSYIDGRSNKEFQRGLDTAKNRCERALSLLRELSGLDLDTQD